MNQAQKKARFEELGLRIKIMRARQRGDIDLASMEQLRTMSSRGDIHTTIKGFELELEVSKDMTRMLQATIQELEARMQMHGQKYGASSFQVGGEIFSSDIDCVLSDMKDIMNGIHKRDVQVQAEIAEATSELAAGNHAINAIQVRGPLTISESHQLIEMVNEHHDLKEELGLR